MSNDVTGKVSEPKESVKHTRFIPLEEDSGRIRRGSIRSDMEMDDNISNFSLRIAFPYSVIFLKQNLYNKQVIK